MGSCPLFPKSIGSPEILPVNPKISNFFTNLLKLIWGNSSSRLENTFIVSSTSNDGQSRAALRTDVTPHRLEYTGIHSSPLKFFSWTKTPFFYFLNIAYHLFCGNKTKHWGTACNIFRETIARRYWIFPKAPMLCIRQVRNRTQCRDFDLDSDFDFEPV